MIFTTVGTHEQQFNRLVKAIDLLVEQREIEEPVFIQTGYSTYEPKYCEWSRFLSFEEMAYKMGSADIIITHGGPSSFIEAMAAGKVPVVVPRWRDLGEHVNDHQADFVRAVEERQGGIVPVYDVTELPAAIERARALSEGSNFESHNESFCEALCRLIEGI